MENKERNLLQTLQERITPLIDSDYVLWDLPYHYNIGDILIWQGEEDFLKQLPYKCKDKSDFRGFDKEIVNPDDIIILHGGGNFGDLYRQHQDFRIKIIQEFPNNKIIIFPQSVFYENSNLLESDAKKLSTHKKLYICARDNYSYELLTKNFSNNIILTPDMAFAINSKIINNNKAHKSNRNTLFLERIDKEKISNKIELNSDVEHKDWPTFEKMFLRFRVLGLFQKILNKFDYKIFKQLYNIYARIAIRKGLIQIGIRFIDPYSKIITTRLHGLILAFILEKDIEYIDGKSKKISDYIATWLPDCNTIRPYTNK